jgi:transcriptional regulator with XRE-family HTH domain
MTQVALATKLGIDRSRLGKWERGHHAPLLIQLVALSWVLEMTLDELLTGRTLAAQPGQPLIDRNTLASVVETLTRLLQCKPARGGLL